MNKILTQTGGQPVFLDDIDFLQNSNMDNFKGLCQGMSQDIIGTCIIQGCEITKTSNGYRWNPGYIAIKGEIFKVNNGSIVTESQLPYWQVVSTQTELRTFEDQTSKPVWVVTEVILTDTPEDGRLYVDAYNIRRYTDIIKEKVFAYESLEIPVNVYSGSGISAVLTVEKYFSYKRINVEISELPDYIPESEGKYFYFDSKYNQLLGNVVMSAFEKVNGNFVMLSFDTDASATTAFFRVVGDNTIPKGFNKLIFQTVI